MSRSIVNKRLYLNHCSITLRDTCYHRYMIAYVTPQSPHGNVNAPAAMTIRLPAGTYKQGSARAVPG